MKVFGPSSSLHNINERQPGDVKVVVQDVDVLIRRDTDHVLSH
jgi:hypothetical protein